MFLWMFSVIGIGIAGLLSVLVLYIQLSMGVCWSNRRLDGQVVVITGGNAGIGFETARDLASRGARVILGCRNIQKGETAVKQLMASLPSGQVEASLLDLAKFSSVRQFSEKLHNIADKVDILINNAGTTPVTWTKLTEDNLDYVLQSNHLGHFLLTNLIKDLILKGESRRIVNVASIAATRCDPQIDWSMLKRGIEMDRAQVYGITKLMNILFTTEIVRRWEDEGIKSYSLHPGLVRSEIFGKADMDDLKAKKMLYCVVYTLVLLIRPFLSKSITQGAQTTLYCALEDNLINGEFYSDCRLAPFYFQPKSKDNQDQATRLWLQSEKLVNLS